MTDILPKTISCPIDWLHNLFVCDYERGLLFNRVVRTWSPAGRQVGSRRTDGYLTVSVKRRAFAVHRIIWAMYYGRWPKGILDHIDGNRTNNAIWNLREATHSLNQANAKVPEGRSSRYRGVSWNKRLSKWQAGIKKDGKSYHLGLHETEEAAHKAYLLKAKELFGDFARAA